MPNLFDITRKIVQTTFETGWGSRTRIEWENVPFDEPDDEWDGSSGFVRVSIHYTSSARASLGTTKLERHAGYVRLSFHLPKNVGTAMGNAHMEAAAAIFRYKQFIDSEVVVNFYAPAVGNMAEKKDRYEVRLELPFHTEAHF